MVEIFLHQYTNNESMTFGMVAPHKYRHPIYVKQGNQKIFIDAWNKDKKLICEKLINRMSEIYEKDEAFLLFTPATKTRLFIDDIIEEIKNYFKNTVDLTDVFTKKTEFSLGEEKYNDYTEEQIEELIEVDIDKINESKKMSSKAFIIDDVYSTGKSLNTTMLLIKKHISEQIEINNGVILKI
jgi:hypothetical protein